MKEFKPILFFLLRLFVTYGILTVLYNLYLNPYLQQNIPDWYTVKTADWVVDIMNWFDQNTIAQNAKGLPKVEIIYRDYLVSYVNEGCNAVSVIIIFISFMVAMKTKLKQTLLYILFGIVTIALLNLIRIVIINFALYYYPEHNALLHDIIFPLIIYGYIVLLWLIWAKYFLLKKQKKDE